jgi:peptidyl-prolyl cis-trans isomerase C
MTLPALADDRQTKGDKAAVVNGVVITKAEFDVEYNRALEQLKRSGRFPGVSELEQLREQILENLIARELLLQECRKMEIKADQNEVDEQLGQLKGRFSSEAEFKSALSEMDITEETLRTQIERDMSIRRLLDKQVVEKIVVSAAETKTYYDNNPDAFKVPEKVRASHILIKVDAQADEAEKAKARKEIESIQRKLQKGEDFAALAKEFSEGPSGPEGGDLGYFGRGQMVKPFEDAAFSLKNGEISDRVETRFGYHLIKVTDRQTESTMAYKEIQEKLGNYLKQEKIKTEVQSYIENLKKSAKIERYLQEQ